VAKIAHEAGIEVDICGQAGEVPQLVPLWIAMGIDNVSVSVPSITKIRRIICGSNKAECDTLLHTILKQETSRDVETMLNTFYEEGQHGNKRA
jgi:phosphotransferase system enzyme I (PtsI)